MAWSSGLFLEGSARFERRTGHLAPTESESEPYGERCVRSMKDEALTQIVIRGERSFYYVIQHSWRMIRRYAIRRTGFLLAFCVQIFYACGHEIDAEPTARRRAHPEQPVSPHLQPRPLTGAQRSLDATRPVRRRPIPAARTVPRCIPAASVRPRMTPAPGRDMSFPGPDGLRFMCRT